MYSLNQIVKKIRIIGEAHGQINYVFYGSVKKMLAQKTVKYPALCFMLSTSSISNKKETFPFEFWIIDQLNLDSDGHELEIHSDALQISTDIVAKMMDEISYEWKLEDGVNRTLFADEVKTSDATAGLLMELTLSQNLRTDRCLIPDRFALRYFTEEFESTFE